MTILRLQLNKTIRRFPESQPQLNRIYNFVLKKFDDVPAHFELQYCHPHSKIKRQLKTNEQLEDLLALKPSIITLLVKPFKNEDKMNKLKKETANSSSVDIAGLLDGLSIQDYFIQDETNQHIELMHCHSSEEDSSEPIELTFD